MIRRAFGHLSEQIQDECRDGILSLMQKKAGASVLDLGCFDGQFTRRIAEHVDAGSVFGLDVDLERLKLAEARSIEAHHGDLNEVFPFESDCFDVIHANQVIEHLSDTDRFVTEIRRTLKPGGYAVIGTPNLAALHNILYLLLGLQPFDASVSDQVVVGSWHPIKLPKLGSTYPMGMVGHRRLFTLGALTGLFEFHGFKIERAIGSGYYPLPMTLARAMCAVDRNHSTYIAIRARKNS